MPTIAVDSGTLHLATVDGGAMFFHDSLDFSAYAGTDAGFTPYKITFTDAAGKTAEAWAAAAGGGETLGSNAISSITNRADLPYDTLTINANGFDVDSGIKTQTAARAVAYTNDIVMLGKLFKVEIAFTLNSGTAPQLRTKTGTNNASRVIVFSVASGAYYWTGVNEGSPENGFAFRSEAADQNNWSVAWTAKQLTDVPATGLHLMSASGGTTRNMDTVEAGFDPNTVVSVELEPIRLFVDITEAESTALESLRDNTTVAGWNDSDGWVDGDGTYDGKAASTSQITVAGGVVTTLDLRANNLVGEFTSAVISAMTSCATINVSLNPGLNCSFDLNDLPTSVTSLNISDTDSDMAGGSSAMSATAIEEILARRAGLSSYSVANVVDRIYADRASFTYATPKLDIGNTYAYGVIWDSATDTYQIGVVYNGTFIEQAIDEFPVHELMRRCVLDDAGVRQYYLLSTDSTKKAANGAAATLDGTDGQVMVEMVKFWSLKRHYGTKRYMFVSDGPFSITMPDNSVATAVIHPVFYAGQATPTERVYCGAYQAAMYDDSASAMMGTVHTDLYAAGDKLCSVSGYYPKTNETIIEFRAAAAARGTGWHQLDAPMLHALQMLYVTKYGTLNSQDAIGMGRTTLTGGVWEAGSHIGICGRSNAVGNASGNTSLGGTAGHAGDYMSFLGIEDFWGNVWQFMDGANVHNSAALGSRLFLCDDYELYASDTDTNYTYAGDLAETDGWVTDIIDADGFWPASVGGSNNSYLCDYYYTYFDDVADSGWHIVRVGGSAINGTRAGAFFVYLNLESANALTNVGGRLCYTPKEGDLK